MHPGLRTALLANRRTISRPTLDVNFAAGTYAWGGGPRSYSDLTVAGGSPSVGAGGLSVPTGAKLNLNNTTWLDGNQGTFLVEWTRADAAEACVFSLQGRGLEVYQMDNPYEGQGFNASNNFSAGARGTKKQRLLIAYQTGSAAVSAYNSDIIATNGATMTSAVAPSNVGFGYRSQLSDDYMLTGTLERVRYWPWMMSTADITSLMLTKVSGKNHIHHLGDSFVTVANLLLIRDNFLNDYRVFTADGVAGSPMVDQTTRFQATPQYWNRLVVHTDGGLSDTQSDAVASARTIKDLCAGYYLYVQPVPTDNAGTGARTTWDATVAAVQTEVGASCYVATLAALQAANDASANDLADVANGLVPRSLRVDNQHLNTAGWTIYAAQIAAKITANGW